MTWFWISRSIGRMSVLFGALALLSACGQEAPPPAASAEHPAEFTGADRDARLLEGAKREGSVSVYSSIPVDVMNVLTDAFEQKYGIRAVVWRGGSEEILQRTITEARGGRHAVDVVESAAAEIEAISRENLLQPVQSPVLAELMPEAAVPGRPWITSRLIVFVTAYNTNLVREADAPRRYEDLADAQWRGKLTTEQGDSNWLMGLSDAIGEERTLTLFRDVVAKNNIAVRNGHGLITNMLASGEVPITFTQYYEQAARAKREGAPIGLAFLNPVIAVPTGLAVMKNAPHPHAAMLFLDFYLTDGQKIIAEEFDYVPTNLKYQKLPEGMQLSVADMGKYVDEFQKWRRTFLDVFQPRAR
jgi:iron(III) transport system substrate-binding protein